MRSQIPSIEGFNSRITFSKKERVKLKIKEAFTTVTVIDWCNEKLMAMNFIVSYGSKYKYQDALTYIKNSPNELSTKYKFFDRYCKNSIKYFKAGFKYVSTHATTVPLLVD
jgi:hypothetical protein